MTFKAEALTRLKIDLERHVAENQPPGLVAWISGAGEQYVLQVGAMSIDGPLILGHGRGWGLGLGVQVTASPYGMQPGAYGWDGGFGTSWFNDPSRDLTAILLTQRVFDSPDPPSVHKQLWQDVYAAVL
jgi:CubicO group peptidase (beta-lactamase class C family)